MAWLARSYAASLAPEQRAGIAAAVAESLGFRDVGQIGLAAQQELQQWRQIGAQLRQQQAAAQQEYRATEQRVAAEIAEFARGGPILSSCGRSWAPWCRRAAPIRSLQPTSWRVS